MNNADRHQADDQWSAFEQGLDLRHQEFILCLTALYPSLGRTEIRVCSMIKLGLNTHEIATLLHNSEWSIESCRHSIRKKMDIKAGERIQAFLESICGCDGRRPATSIE